MLLNTVEQENVHLIYKVNGPNLVFYVDQTHIVLVKCGYDCFELSEMDCLVSIMIHQQVTVYLPYLSSYH